MKYRKKPVVVDAMQFTGVNYQALSLWGVGFPNADGWNLPPRFNIKVKQDGIVICTLEGDMTARPGDWIIRGVKGEFYPCRDDIFKATYEPAGE